VIVFLRVIREKKDNRRGGMQQTELKAIPSTLFLGASSGSTLPTRQRRWSMN